LEKDKHKVSVIIPNYNRKRYLERLLPSIANQTFVDYEVIIIDDFSPDKSAVEYIRYFIKDRKNMRLVENTANIGFVKTCNKGIMLASGEYLCILTNDTEVKKDFIERNMAILDTDSSIGVLSCIIVDQYGNNWFTGGLIKAGFFINLKDDFTGVRKVDFIAGTAAFYRRELFNKVGLLNEYFYMYHEDVEFCLRLKNETNYIALMFADKLVTHYTGLASLAHKQLLYYIHRNHILILKSYFPKYIPRAIFHYSREIVNLLFMSVSKLRPSYVLLTFHIIGGTFNGLIRGQNG